ncbi:hypothetical protein, partial [Phormidium sp. CCY1219]|uniref:hypothetical protein n=1 Tax=Phormidium sp. CCY1219 TaxID=2886104 RepID=UPI002D1E6478
EQLHLVDVFLPPEEYLSPGQVKEKLDAYKQQQRQQVAQLQTELQRAKAQIARYKDPANHPALLRQQEQIDTMQAKL